MKESPLEARTVDFDAGLAWSGGAPDERPYALVPDETIAEAAAAVLRVTAAAWGLACWPAAAAYWAN